LQQAEPGVTSGITVVVAAYNGEAVIARCLESLTAQTLPPEQIVVVDDGSTDDTTSVVESVRERWPDLVTLVRQPNGGTGVALTTGVSVATTEFVAIADQDDWFVPERLAISSALIRETGADMVGGQVIGRLGARLRFATSRFPTDAAGIAQRISAGLDPLAHITMMVRRDGFDRFGGYRSIRRAEDLELMLRWAHRGARLAVSPEVLAVYSFRPEFFSIDTQTRWMILTRYVREVAVLPDDEIPDFARWFSQQRLAPARREAIVRVARLSARLGAGTVLRR
jgi:glycosyltransferase involved in cell wall biosynthesis